MKIKYFKSFFFCHSLTESLSQLSFLAFDDWAAYFLAGDLFYGSVKPRESSRKWKSRMFNSEFPVAESLTRGILILLPCSGQSTKLNWTKLIILSWALGICATCRVADCRSRDFHLSTQQPGFKQFYASTFNFTPDTKWLLLRVASF